MATTSPAAAKKADWSATQYLKFNNERTRPVYDLVAQISPLISSKPNPRIFDLGCGPGNSTQVLLEAFPDAKITGVDSSPDMLAKARASLPGLTFEEGNLETWKVAEGEQVDVLFSNAVFHWLRTSRRIPTVRRLLENRASGSVVAFQVPDNYDQRSHALMRATASMSGEVWSDAFNDTAIGDLKDAQRPDLDPIETPNQWYDALQPLSASVNLWRTEYQHALGSANAIVEWVKGTGLQPYLHRIADQSAKEAFLKEYERKLSEAYPPLADGKVLLGYPRLFVVAVRK